MPDTYHKTHFSPHIAHLAASLRGVSRYDLALPDHNERGSHEAAEDQACADADAQIGVEDMEVADWCAPTHKEVVNTEPKENIQEGINQFEPDLRALP